MAGYHYYSQGTVYPPSAPAQPPNLEAMSQYIPVNSTPHSYSPYFGQPVKAAGYATQGYHGQQMPHFSQHQPLTPSTMSHTLSSSGTPATFPRHQRARSKPKARPGRRRRLDQGPEPSSADIFPEDTETVHDSPDRMFHLDALLEDSGGRATTNPWDAEDAQYTNMFPHPHSGLTPEHFTFSGSKLNPKASAFTGSTLNPNAEAFTSSNFNPNAATFTGSPFNPTATSFGGSTVNPNTTSFASGTFNPNTSFTSGTYDSNTSFAGGPFDPNTSSFASGKLAVDDDTYSASTLNPYADRSPPSSGVAKLLRSVPEHLREATAEILGEEATQLLTEEDKKTQDISDLQIPFQLRLPIEKQEPVDDRPGVPIFRKAGHREEPPNAYELSLKPQPKQLSWTERDGSKYGLGHYGIGLAACGDSWEPPRQDGKSGFGKVSHLWDDN